MIVSCSQCGVKLKVDENKIKEGGSRLKCPKCQNIFTVYRPQEAQPQAPAAPAAPQAPAPPVVKWNLDRRKVLVAHGGETVLKTVEGILSAAGFETITATDGVHAMMEIENHKPAVVILDVGLPSIYGFEICERLKASAESSDVKVILIASIFDKTKYKREPTSLYGADDYIEKHHIQDTLARKVNRILSPVASGAGFQREEAEAPPAPTVQTPAMQQQAEQMRNEETKDLSESAPVNDQQVEAARRFARIILSDIALYNQRAVEEGIRNNNFQSVLSAELNEGRELYNSRVPLEVRNQMDYFADEMDKFIEKKKHIMDVS